MVEPAASTCLKPTGYHHRKNNGYVYILIGACHTLEAGACSRSTGYHHRKVLALENKQYVLHKIYKLPVAASTAIKKTEKILNYS